MKALLILLMLFPTVLWAGCDDNAQLRVVKGADDRAGALYGLIKGDEPSWSQGFHQETFVYLGRLKSGYEVAHMVTLWGQSCRATNRLLLFSQGLYKGNFGGIADVPEVRGNMLVYEFDEAMGRAINFEYGIPEEIYLNGVFYSFDRLEPLEKKKRKLNTWREHD